MNTMIRYAITTFLALPVFASASAFASPRFDVSDRLIALKTEAPAPTAEVKTEPAKPSTRERAILSARREMMRHRLSLALRQS